MKKNSLIDLKKSDIKTLLDNVKKTRQEIRSLSMDKLQGKLKNVKEIKNKRRDLAQALTTLKQKQLLEGVKTES